MSDYGSEYTDRRQKIIEYRLLKVYTEAKKDLSKKLEEYTRKFAQKDAEMRRRKDEGVITPQQYKDWQIGQVFTGKRWDAKVREAATALLTSNQLALDVIRGEQFNVFAENADFMAYCMEKDMRGGISFDIYDTTTVERLLREKPELLPRKELNGRKDKAWNQGIISNSVAQGIIQGESIPDLAKRIARDTAQKNDNAMIRYARTAMTAAQNSGRLETMHRAQDMGIKVKKTWIATLDSVTRDAHAELDGVSVDIDEPFVNEYGEIDYPGDPGADGANTWNCRCTLGYEYPEYASMEEQRANLRYDQEYGEVIEDMDYPQWAEWRKEQTKERYSDYNEEDWDYEYTTNRYRSKQGKGTLLYDNGFKKKQKNAPERAMAKWLSDHIGGIIRVKKESEVEGIKSPDYLWNGRRWDLKCPTTTTAAKSAIKSGLKQIKPNPGGIILNYGNNTFNPAEVEKTMDRLLQHLNHPVEVIVISNDRVVLAKRYKREKK